MILLSLPAPKEEMGENFLKMKEKTINLAPCKQFFRERDGLNMFMASINLRITDGNILHLAFTMALIHAIFSSTVLQCQIHYVHPQRMYIVSSL